MGPHRLVDGAHPKQLLVVVPRIGRDVGVAIDQAGKHGGVPEVDHPGVARRVAGDRVRRAHFLDAIPFNKDGLVGEHRPSADGDEAPGAHEYLGMAGRVRLGGERVRDREASDHERQAGAPAVASHRVPLSAIVFSVMVFSTRWANTCAAAGAIRAGSPLIS